MGNIFRMLTVFSGLLTICMQPAPVVCAPPADAASSAPVMQTLPEAEFKSLFVDYICRQLGKDRGDVVLSKLKVLGNKPLPAGKMACQIFQKDHRQLEGLVRLIGVVRVDGEVKNKVRLSGWVDLFDKVVCTSGKLRRGDAIGAGDVRLVRKNISHLPKDVLTKVEQAIGQVLKRQVKEGDLVTAVMLDREPAVSRGAMITIVAESSLLRVTAPGKALMQGEAGDLIKVQNLMSNKKIHAKIIDDSTVIVDF